MVLSCHAMRGIVLPYPARLSRLAYPEKELGITLLHILQFMPRLSQEGLKVTHRTCVGGGDIDDLAGGHAVQGLFELEQGHGAPHASCIQCSDCVFHL
jgi:hypothetical protein